MALPGSWVWSMRLGVGFLCKVIGINPIILRQKATKATGCFFLWFLLVHSPKSLEFFVSLVVFFFNTFYLGQSPFCTTTWENSYSLELFQESRTCKWVFANKFRYPTMEESSPKQYGYSRIN